MNKPQELRFSGGFTASKLELNNPSTGAGASCGMEVNKPGVPVALTAPVHFFQSLTSTIPLCTVVE